MRSITLNAWGARPPELMRLNDRFQLLPRHNLIHLGEKALNSSWLRFHRIPHRGLHEGYSTGFKYFCRGFYILRIVSLSEIMVFSLQA